MIQNFLIFFFHLNNFAFYFINNSTRQSACIFVNFKFDKQINAIALPEFPPVFNKRNANYVNLNKL